MQTRNTSKRLFRTAWLTVSLMAVFVATAAANRWNDKTTLTFSEPVMVPGATLQPGTYVFKLTDSATNRHLVLITNEDESKVISTAQAVPMKRLEPKGATVLKFAPTDTGSPPALKGWYYPGSLYGHEFLYPAQQAKELARRAKTIVLSVDVPQSDLQRGSIRTFDETGKSAEWKGDEATLREWNDWRQERTAAATTNSGDRSEIRERRQATAPMVKGDFETMRVRLDELEDNPQKYIGKTISVDAAIQEVHGPRVFTIDEPRWGDLEGEILTYVPTMLAAAVREGDRVTITGTVKPFVRADVEREWGWLGLDPEVEVDLARKPVLVASEVVGGNNDVALVIDLTEDESKTVGTSGSAANSLSDVSAIANAEEDMVARHVELTGIRIASMAKDRGFFVKAGNDSVFVLPTNDTTGQFKSGDTVSLDGTVLEMPKAMRDRLNAPAGANDDIYVFADVTRQPS